MTIEPFTSCQLIGSGDEYYERIITEMDKAESEIIMESYIFDYDEIGKRVLQALARASQRQVTTRLMIDGIGGNVHVDEIRNFCSSHLIRFRVFRPLPRLLVTYTRFTQFMRTANRRNHRKIIIIDRKTAFVGSFNISRVHSESLVDKRAWKDLAAIVQGPEVAKIAQLAGAYWTKFRLSLMGRIPKIDFLRVRSTHSMAARRTSRNQLVEKIRNSKSQIRILTPYFVPSNRLIRALKQATRNHENIEIIIPLRSDFLIVDLAARYIIRKLLARNIKIYQYLPSFLHAKSVTVDNWATMGSNNLNHRSLVHDLELDITLEDPSELSSLENYWLSIRSQSRLVTRDSLDKDSLFLRLLCRFSFWFKNWL